MAVAFQEIEPPSEKGRTMRVLAERAALREDAARLLDELGGTAGDVAVSLYFIGVRARASNADACSVARYLQAVVGADTRVRRLRVTKRWLVLTTPRRWWSTVRVRLPQAVREFTVSVDRIRPDQPAEVPFEDNQA
jgi:hypothetical protein